MKKNLLYKITVLCTLSGNYLIAQNGSPMGITSEPTFYDHVGYNVAENTGADNVTDVAVNSKGVIATTGWYTGYKLNTEDEYTKFNGLFFHNEDFSPLTSHFPVEDTKIDNVPSTTTGNFNSHIIALRDDSFVYVDGRNIYKVISDGTRTLLTNRYNVRDIYASKYDDVIYVVASNGTKLYKIDYEGNEDTNFSFDRNWTATHRIIEVDEQSDGKIILGIVGGGGIIRMDNTTGKIDNTFDNPTGIRNVWDIAVQSDDKIIVAIALNASLKEAGKTYNGLARVPKDGGSLDSSFAEQTWKVNYNRNGAPSKVTLNSKDEIYLSGSVISQNQTYSLGNVAKLSKDGVVDIEFRNNNFGTGRSAIRDIIIQPDDKLLVINDHGMNNLYHNGVIRLLSNGIVDTPINNTQATGSNRDGLNVFFINAAAYASRHYYPIVNYSAGEESIYNAAGYQPAFVNNLEDVNVNTASAKAYSQIDDKVAVGYAGTGIAVYGQNGREIWSEKGSSASKTNSIYGTDVSPDKSTLAWFDVNANKIEYRKVEDGALAINSKGETTVGGVILSLSYEPTGKYLYVAKSNTSIVRIDATTGEVLTTIPIQGIGRPSIYNMRVKFYSDTDFYVYKNVANNIVDYLYKGKLVDENGNPSATGNKMVLDTDFAFDGELQLSLKGKNDGNNPYLSHGYLNGWEVSPDGEVFVSGFTGSGQFTPDNPYGDNITKVNPDGTTEPLYIRVGNVSSQAGGTGTVRNGYYLFDYSKSSSTDTTDTDGDGIIDSIDLDDDNDGIPDSVEESTATNGGDTDGDGIPDSLDLDSDGDGIPDLEESGLPADVISELDTNNDGVIDPSNDVGTNGIADVIEPKGEDGGVNSNAVDYDNDGVSDAPQDTDSDGIPDFQDKDSDNDGVTDLTEGGTDPSLDTNNDGVIDNQTDIDGDGIADVIDDNTSSFGGDESNGAPDTDGDGIKDFRDLDSDDDGLNDADEAGVPDTNGDGLDDTPNESFADGEDLPDTNGDGIPNILEPNGPVITGPDTDQDGIKDSEDGKPEEFGDAPFPDFTVQISSRPAAIEDGGNLSVRVNVVEITGNPSLEGKPIVVRIPEETFYGFNFNPDLTEVSGEVVNNADWEYLGTQLGLHTYRYKPSTFEGLTSSAIGFEGTVSFEGTSSTSISAFVVDTSGGEVNFENNVDTEQLNLKNN